MRPRSAISFRCRSRLVGAISAVALGTALERGGHNDRRIRMTLTDLTVDIVPIIGAVAGKRRNRARNLLQQGTDLRAVPPTSLLVSSAAMICPVSASTPIWSFRQDRRVLVA